MHGSTTCAKPTLTESGNAAFAAAARPRVPPALHRRDRPRPPRAGCPSTPHQSARSRRAPAAHIRRVHAQTRPAESGWARTAGRPSPPRSGRRRGALTACAVAGLSMMKRSPGRCRRAPATRRHNVRHCRIGARPSHRNSRCRRLPRRLRCAAPRWSGSDHSQFRSGGRPTALPVRHPVVAYRRAGPAPRNRCRRHAFW